ncbi:MAG: LysR substrate-binding domain-containing protein [Spongiibacteraceae bacterium]
MNLQQLRHFIAIAEERHFGRAAERLHIAQPPLSQSLVRLETSIGFRLIDRTRRSVALTPAGEIFLRELRPVMMQLDRAVRMATRANEGHLSTINLGFVSGAIIEAVPTLLRVLEEQLPDAEVTLHEMPTQMQIQALLDGSLDLGLVYSHRTQGLALQTRVIARYGMQAAIPESWPLAQKERLHMSDLKDVPMILVPYEDRSDLRAIFFAECQRHGFEPLVRHEVTRGRTVLGLVSAGQGMALGGDAEARQGYPGVAFRPLDGLPPNFSLELSIAWPSTHALQEHEERFVKIVETLIAASGHSPESEAAAV